MLQPFAELHQLLLCRLQAGTAALLVPTTVAAGQSPAPQPQQAAGRRLFCQPMQQWLMRMQAALRWWWLVPPVRSLPPPHQCRWLQKVLRMR